MTDLIDRDALRKRYQFCHDVAPEVAVASRKQLEHDISMLDAAPAVRCGECRHAMTWTTPTGEEFPFGNCYAAVGQANGDDGELSPNPPNFGCVYFERRRP